VEKTRILLPLKKFWISEALHKREENVLLAQKFKVIQEFICSESMQFISKKFLIRVTLGSHPLVLHLKKITDFSVVSEVAF